MNNTNPWWMDPTEPPKRFLRVHDAYEDHDFQDILDRAINNLKLKDGSSQSFLADVLDLWDIDGVNMEWSVEQNDRLFEIIEG